jgi:hypothetical protein
MPRRKTLVSVGAVAAVAALVTSTSTAQAAPALITQSFNAQASAPPTTAGDAFVLADQDVAGTTVIGHDVLACTVHAGGSTCEVAFAQPGGLLYAHFSIDDADGTVAGTVTGGTGHYCHAHGRLTGATLSPTDVQITLHYTR